MPNIKVILAHELGHLLSQSVIHFSIPRYKSIAYEIEYVGDPHYPWIGRVVNNLDKLVPTHIQYEIIIKKYKWFVYELFTLSAGCVIQNIYERRVLGSASALNDCFSLNKTSLGIGDYCKYNDILRLFLDRYNLSGQIQKVNFLYSLKFEFYNILDQDKNYELILALVEQIYHEYIEPRDFNSIEFKLSIVGYDLKVLISNFINQEAITNQLDVIVDNLRRII